MLARCDKLLGDSHLRMPIRNTGVSKALSTERSTPRASRPRIALFILYQLRVAVTVPHDRPSPDRAARRNHRLLSS